MSAEPIYTQTYGTPQHLADGIRVILCPNASAMTYHGTNTYLVGTTDIAVIDPGPALPAHLDAILTALRPGQRISHIVVTHSHLDHSPLARALQDKTQAPIFGFGDATAGRSAIMEQIASLGLSGGGEGIDTAFVPDHALVDGQSLAGADWQLDVIHTPGHLGNHICLGLNDACFTGDHVMGWASSLVSPPDGDLTDFMQSCTRLQNRDWSVFYPGHGAPVSAPQSRLDWLIAHRRSRETSILDFLTQAPATPAQIAQAIYTNTPAALLPAAERNVFAHLIDLKQKNMVLGDGDLGIATVFHLVQENF